MVRSLIYFPRFCSASTGNARWTDKIGAKNPRRDLAVVLGGSHSAVGLRWRAAGCRYAGADGYGHSRGYGHVDAEPYRYSYTRPNRPNSHAASDTYRHPDADPHRHIDTGADGYRNAGADGHVDAGTDCHSNPVANRHPDAGTDYHAHAGTNRYADARTDSHANAGADGHADAGADSYANAGAYGHTDAGADGHTNTGDDGHANAGADGHANAGAAYFRTDLRICLSIDRIITTVANKGSGVLIEGGYVVTNAHVVWPYATVRVVFPDGSEFLEVPVKGLDLLADLAVLGPIDPPTGAVELVDGESLPIGSETFVIGYPKVTEEFPRPTIVRGLLSRVVEMEFVGITNLQIDAALAPGHSGSALVSDRGEVIGITGFAITDANFGVATSSGDILPRVRQLIAGEDPSQLGDRRVPLEGAALSHEIALENLWAQGSYVIDELPGSIINIDLKGDQGGELAIVNSLSSLLLYLDSGNSGAATGSFAVEYRGPNFLIVQRWAETPSKFTLTSSHRLIPIHDPGRWQANTSGRVGPREHGFPWGH